MPLLFKNKQKANKQTKTNQTSNQKMEKFVEANSPQISLVCVQFSLQKNMK